MNRIENFKIRTEVADVRGISNGSETQVDVAAIPSTEVPDNSEAPTSSFTPAVKPSLFVTQNMGSLEYEARYRKVVKDAMEHSKCHLQKLYPAEYNSLRSRRQQAKSRHIKFFDSLKDIRDWLIHLGPRPGAGWTVDRIKSAKGYQPGNLRWATKIQQTQNRKVTRWHLLPDGERITTKALADRVGLPYQTVYKRLRAGWAIDRLLGRDLPRDLKSWKFPIELADFCQPLYNLERRYYKVTRIEWFIKYFNEVIGKETGRALPINGCEFPKALSYFNAARNAKMDIERETKEFEKRKLQELLIILNPQVPDQPKPDESEYTPPTNYGNGYL